MDPKWKFEDLGYDLNMSFNDVEGIKGDLITLSAWLTDDIRDYRPILEDVIKVLDGNSEYEELWCNLFTADVYKDYTEIRSNFEGQVHYKRCKLPTPLLREILEAWFEEREKYYANKK